MISLKRPRMSGESDHEALYELRSYIYQLVDQLQFALDSLETLQKSEGGNTSSTANENLEAFRSIKPYIMKSKDIATLDSEGYLNGWYVRKWSSGYTECWRRDEDLSFTLDTEYASGLYKTQVSSVAYPLIFAAEPLCQISCESRGETPPLLISSGEGTSMTSPSATIFGNTNQAVNVNMQYYVQGIVTNKKQEE